LVSRSKWRDADTTLIESLIFAFSMKTWRLPVPQPTVEEFQHSENGVCIKEARDNELAALPLQC
jgi:hypothetical protein